MAIPDAQIQEWSQRPSSLLPGWTCQVLHDALDNAERLRNVNFEIFVQGSYANGTNIKHNSDVDLVVQLKMPFMRDLDELSASERKAFFRHYHDADYGWKEFKVDVVSSLREAFYVVEGRKCVDVSDLDSLVRVPADILPVVEYRRYRDFVGLERGTYDEGIFFRDAAGLPIWNFPKLHLRNGSVKDSRTRGRFKQIVRVFKNARSHESAGLQEGAAPSYLVECLLYNVPDERYRGNLREAYTSCLGWLSDNRAGISDFRCPSGIGMIFGDAPDQWSLDSALTLLSALDHQWGTFA